MINKPTTPDVAVKREAPAEEGEGEEGSDEPPAGIREGLLVPEEDPPLLLLLPLLDAAVAVFDGLAVAIAPTPPVNTVPVGS